MTTRLLAEQLADAERAGFGGDQCKSMSSERVPSPQTKAEREAPETRMPVPTLSDLSSPPPPLSHTGSLKLTLQNKRPSPPP